MRELLPQLRREGNRRRCGMNDNTEIGRMFFFKEYDEIEKVVGTDD